MSQKMNVVCCCSCEMYQVHIVKKAKTWQCKVCGEKQSFIKIFFEGSGKDCRLSVQNLNLIKSKELNLKVSKLNCDNFSPQNVETNLLSKSTFKVGSLFHSSISNDYSSTFELNETLENEPTEEDNNFNIKESYSNYSKAKRENEEKEKICYNSKSGKRSNDDAEDFSVSRKKLKKEISFADLVEKSDSDDLDETEIVEVEPKMSQVNSSIFESNDDIDFSLDF